MDLANYSPTRRDIPLGAAGTLSVRGLSLADVSLLVEAHQNSLVAAYASFEQMRGQAGSDDTTLFATLALGLVREAPQVAADIIALAADQPHAAKGAANLQFPVQVQALIAIASLTFEAGGGLGELLAALRSAGRGIGIEIEAKTLPKPNPTSRRKS